MDTQDSTTIYALAAPKFSNLWKLVALIFISIFSFFLYDVADLGMFFCCLIAYLSQLIGFAFIMDNPRQINIKVTDYSKFIRRLKIYEVLFVVLSLVIILVDLAPFNVWIGSRWLISLYWTFCYSDSQLATQPLYFLYYEGHWIIYIMTIITILFIVLSTYYMLSDYNALKREFAEFLASGKTKEQIKQEEILAEKAEEEKEHSNKVQKYGASYKEIKVCNESIIVSEENSIICLYGTDYKFQDILNVQIHDDSRVIQSTTPTTAKTKTGSMVGRAIIGDIVAGPIGGIIGGATAKKQIDIGEQECITAHNYSVYVTVNNISQPVVKIHIGGDELKLNEIYSIFKIIIKRNQDKN